MLSPHGLCQKLTCKILVKRYIPLKIYLDILIEIILFTLVIKIWERGHGGQLPIAYSGYYLHDSI